MLESVRCPPLAPGFGIAPIGRGLSKMGWGEYRLTLTLPVCAPRSSRVIVFPDNAEFLVHFIVFESRRRFPRDFYSQINAIRGRFFSGFFRTTPPTTQSTVKFSSRAVSLLLTDFSHRDALTAASVLALRTSQPAALVISQTDKAHLVARILG